MHVWNVLHAARWNIGRKKSPYAHHRTNCRAMSSPLRYVSTIEKNWLNSNNPSTCAHNMVNFGPLTAEIGWRFRGTPANFDGFRVLASLLQRLRSPEVSQALHDVWPSLGPIHYIYIFGGSCHVTEFCQVQNWLCVQVLYSPILSALRHGTRTVGVIGWAAITLVIGPHSSWILFSYELETTQTVWLLIQTIDGLIEIFIKHVLRFLKLHQDAWSWPWSCNSCC